VRLAFMGSPAFSVPALQALVAAGHEIAAVYCQPPKPAHRGQALTRCPVHVAADALGLAVRTPARLKRDEAEHAAFAALGLDAAVVVAYGLILPPAMLEAPARGCLNIHASLLPRWRGAAPIQAAILAGDAESGITIMRMDAGLDTGPMLLAEATPITEATTAPALHDTLAGMGARLILRALAENPPPVPQPEEGATYAPKLGPGDRPLDFGQEAAVLARRVRALNPWPGTVAAHRGVVLKVLGAVAVPERTGAEPGTLLAGGRVACGGGGVLALTHVQRPGKAPQEIEAFLRGTPLPPGERLETPLQVIQAP
jgi:methionyl-tRNA formyltransferase